MFVFLKHGKQFFSMYMLTDLQTRNIFPYRNKNEIYKLMTCVLIMIFIFQSVSLHGGAETPLYIYALIKNIPGICRW